MAPKHAEGSAVDLAEYARVSKGGVVSHPLVGYEFVRPAPHTGARISVDFCDCFANFQPKSTKNPKFSQTPDYAAALPVFP